MHSDKKNAITFSIPKDKIVFTVESVEANTITLGLKNNSEEPLSFGNPKYSINAAPFLYLNGKTVDGRMKPYSIRENRKKLLYLKPQEKIMVTYDFKLDEIYRSLSPGNYELQFQYFGDIIGEGKQFMILGNSVIKSNRFSIKL